jgi:hypothetical protein
MTEAVAGLSLAASVLQALDFGKPFTCAAWKIYRSGAEGVDLLSDVQSVSNDLRSFLKDLQEGTHRPRASPTVKGDDGIFLLAEKRAVVLNQMLQSLDSIGTPGAGRKRNAIKTDFMVAWKKGGIESLQTRLDQFRDELTLHLVFSLR